MKIELKENGQPSKEEILQMGQGQKQVILAGEEPLNRVGIVDIVKKLQAEEIYIETDGQKLESMAEKLKKALMEKGYTMYLDSPTNQQFVILENRQMERLAKKVAFSFWETLDEDHTAVRFVTSWATDPQNLEALWEILAQEAGQKA